jgi:hypothetical protein
LVLPFVRFSPEPTATVCPDGQRIKSQDHGPSDSDYRLSRIVDSSPERPLAGASKLTHTDVDRAKERTVPRADLRPLLQDIAALTLARHLHDLR